MKTVPWRERGEAERAEPAAVPGETAAATAGQSPPTLDQASQPMPRVLARIVALEPWLVPVTALLLLLAPNPLVWPAAIIGALPSLARLLTTGRLWRATAFDVPLLLLAIGGLLGGYASLSRDGALVRLTGLLAAFILFAAIREHVQSERALRRAVIVGLVASVVASVLLLVLVGPFLLLDRVPPLATLVTLVDRWHAGDWVVDQDWLLQRYRFRASGVGALADVGLALAAAAIVGLRGWLPRILALLTVPLFLIVLVVADNRGSMLAAALTLGVMATVWRRRLLPLVPVVVVAGLLVVAFGPSDRGLSLKTLAQRFWFWENSLYLAREVPLTGAGLGLESVQLVYRAYFQPAYPPFSHAHNIYLQGLLEYGIFGMLGLVGLGLAALWVGWRASAGVDRRTMAARLAGFGVALAMMTTGLTEVVLLSTLGGVLAIVALGLLAASNLTPQPPLRAGEGEPAVDLTLKQSPDLVRSLPRAIGSPSPRRRGGWGVRSVSLAASLIVAVVAVAFSPVGPRLGARLLLNIGTADLNRGSLSETIARDDRSAALDRATNLLRTASTLDPDNVAIQRNLALALAANDDPRRGRAAADRAKALTSSSNKGDLFQLGRAYVAVSAWGEAIRAWQAAEAGPQLIQLGGRLIRARNFEQAINAFVATARIDPESGGAYDGIARAAHERKSTVDETVDELEPLMEAGSATEYGARLQAARELRTAGRLNEAGAQLQRAEQVSSGPELSLEYGLLWMGAGLPYFAEQVLVRPAADMPYEPDSWYWLARAYADAGRHQEAVATIRQGLSRVDPSGQFAPPAERLPETAAVRAAEIKRSERAPLLGVLGESLIQLGRADEALPALDEAVAAAPKDGWLASVQAQARAVAGGAPTNLLLNPSFDRSGSWALRPIDWLYRATIPTLWNAMPTIENGQARLTAAMPERLALAQDVFNLAPEGRYRLSVRLRTERLGAGTVVVSLVPSGGGEPVRRELRGDDAADWTTVTLEATPGPPPVDDLSPRLQVARTSSLTVQIDLVAAPASGAAVWCDEATLIPADDAR